MYCTNCGAKLPDGSKFCPKCGSKTGSKAEVEAPKKERKEEKTVQASKPKSNVKYNINELKPISPLRKAIFPVGLVGAALAVLGLILTCACGGESESIESVFKASRIIFGVSSIISLIMCGLMIAHTIIQAIKLRKGYIKKEIAQVCINGVVGILLFVFFITTVTCVFDEFKYSEMMFKQLAYFGWMFSLLIYCVVYAKLFASTSYAKVETNDKIKQVVAISSLIAALVAFLPSIFVIVGAAKAEEGAGWFYIGYNLANFVIGVIGFVAFAALTCLAPVILTGGEKRTKNIVISSVFGGVTLVMFIVSAVMFKGPVEISKWVESYKGCTAVIVISWAIALAAGIAQLVINKKALGGLVVKSPKAVGKTEGTKVVYKKTTEAFIEVTRAKGTKGLRTASFVIGLIGSIILGCCAAYYLSLPMIVAGNAILPEAVLQAFRYVPGVCGILAIIVCILMFVTVILQAIKIRRNSVKTEIVPVFVTFALSIAGLIFGILLALNAFSEERFTTNAYPFYQYMGLLFTILLFNTACGKVYANGKFKEKNSGLLMLRSIGKTIGITGILCLIFGAYVMLIGLAINSSLATYTQCMRYNWLTSVMIGGMLLALTILLILAIPVVILNNWEVKKAKVSNIVLYSVFAGLSLVAIILIFVFTTNTEETTPKMIEDPAVGSIVCFVATTLTFAAGIAGLAKAKKLVFVKQAKDAKVETKKAEAK